MTILPDEELRRLGRDARIAARDAAEEAAAAVTARAARDGLLDVAYTTIDTPIGPILAASTRRGLVRVAFAHEVLDDVLEELAAEISPRVLELPAELDGVRRELDEYFERRREEFDLPLDWRLSRGFRRRVLRATARIPYGRTATYAEMAERAGNPRAYRAAGSALGSNPIPLVVPCHRVLRTGGELGGYGGGPDLKRRLLRLEGVL